MAVNDILRNGKPQIIIEDQEILYNNTIDKASLDIPDYECFLSEIEDRQNEPFNFILSISKPFEDDTMKRTFRHYGNNSYRPALIKKSNTCFTKEINTEGHNDITEHMFSLQKLHKTNSLLSESFINMARDGFDKNCFVTISIQEKGRVPLFGNPETIIMVTFFSGNDGDSKIIYREGIVNSNTCKETVNFIRESLLNELTKYGFVTSKNNNELLIYTV
jgi:hypothetical protein